MLSPGVQVGVLKPVEEVSVVVLTGVVDVCVLSSVS
jgi:hypothetical protein